ncbi:MAG: DUF255 domain-containing protein [Planctomycetales bacterium]|nr:DUF255 domain-containing protein [Planctomycetales bacterium]
MLNHTNDTMYFRGLSMLLVVCHCSVNSAQELSTGPSREEASSPPAVAQVHTNALAGSTSPYLLQHAHNPVHWMPWGAAAFLKAQQENKPIFLSIGYSTCFWCHVMERESFEDEEVAAILNEHYIAIKVDREQRPDIDEQMMLATQLMTGRGGWPNSVWLTTDGRPWMAGTYFPKSQFMAALTQLSRIWQDEPAKVQLQADSLSQAVRNAAALQTGSPSVINVRPVDRALEEMTQLFDSQHGGFGSHPKFPPHGQLRLLSHLALTRREESLKMLTSTLDAMWCGGIHDHIGGGFHRYSTDQRWFLPHFEKMLYDNAQLIRAYAEAYELTERPLYRQAVDDIFTWVDREMTDPQGGFYSALDSESDGVEGAYYTWTSAELSQILLPAEFVQFVDAYHISEGGNFVEEATGKPTGTNIPYMFLDQLHTLDSEESSLPLSNNALAGARAKLREARQHRRYPHRDDKVITAWNGLMIAALAQAGRILNEPRYTSAAENAALFIMENMVDEQGRLLRNWRQGRAEGLGYLNDYAFLADGLMQLFLTTHDVRWRDATERLIEKMHLSFEDSSGGYFFSSLDHEELLTRTKHLNGSGNLPSGNGVAVNVLLDLYESTYKQEYLFAARQHLGYFAQLMQASPRQVEYLVLAESRWREIEDQLTADDAGAAEPDDRQSTIAVTAELRVRPTKLSVADAKDGFQAVVDLLIGDGYHIYGSAPSSDESPDLSVQETIVELMDSPEFVVRSIERPDGTEFRDEVLGQTLTIYEGKVRFVLNLSLTGRAGRGETSIPLVVRLTFQACDSRTCLAPAKLLLRATIRLSE